MIYHLTKRTAWNKALQEGVYRAESLETEGFIHCSTYEQLGGVANTFYRGEKDLIVLVIAPEKLTSPLEWEAPMHPKEGEYTHLQAQGKFPHVYGSINLEAVLSIVVLLPNAEGNSAPSRSEITDLR